MEINAKFLKCSMSFYSKGFSKKGRGRGNMPHGFWKHGKNKKIRFFVHFNADSEELYQLATKCHLYLGPPNPPYQSSLSHVPHRAALQPHPNIHEFSPQNANDGWKDVQLNPPNENQGWGHPFSPLTQDVASNSSSESPHSDDFPHK